MRWQLAFASSSGLNSANHQMVDWKRHLTWKLLFFFKYFLVLAGGRRPPGPSVFGWGGKAPPDPPLKRSFVTFDRGGQTGPPRSNDFFFGAADDMRAGPTTVRRPSDDRPLAVRQQSTVPTVLRYLLFLPDPFSPCSAPISPARSSIAVPPSAISFVFSAALESQ